MTYAQKYGSLINMKIENMREQHSAILSQNKQETAAPAEKAPAEKQPYGIVTVAMGEGIAELFESIGATKVIEGGQTMNPSTEDIVQAIKDANADTVVILPNNSNIVMAANQAADVAGQDVIVIPTKTVPQGMAALLAFNPALGADENEAAMLGAIGEVKSGQITYAVRDTNIDGIDIKKGDFMGILNGKIVETASDQLTAAKKLLAGMIDEDSEIVTVIKGEDAPEEEAEELAAFISETYEDVEVEVHDGKQPLYSYILAVE